MYYYVYRITNTAVKKHYYGKRSSKYPPNQDLGVRYFSSSKDKEFIEAQHSTPEIFRYKVVKICTSNEEAVSLEIKLHNKFNVGNNTHFYNRAKQTTTKFDTTGCKLSDEHKKRCSPLGRKMTQQTKDKIRAKAIERLKNPEERLKISKGVIGKKRSLAVREQMSKARRGHKHSEAFKQRRQILSKGRNNPRAKPVDIFDYSTEQCIAANVIATEWCKNTEYVSNMLLQTLKRDVSRPYCFSTKNPNYNPLHYKGLYVVLSTCD